MSQVNMDELVASLKHSHIGNEARELSTLHAQLSKALLQFPHFPQTPIPSSPVNSHAPLGGFAPPTTPTHGRAQYFDQIPQGGHYQYAPPASPEMQSHSLSPSPPVDSFATADPFYAAQQAQLNSWPRAMAAQRR
ncbi:hypothetical protein RSOLAG22IIIB_00489 [Rhizoctonia solani]|uniref:Uncharacterized protein n=1 Tax=Rhizoctonia solani TaxID=456999 RepID=A0A0K6FVD2_9AGAM|nr:hypothetical protein RSOLAG22IIIB_00489 [Rhizoctonia solani]